MMQSEFEELISKKVDPSDYEVVEFVYTYHPSIGETEGKKQIATIYGLPGGMRIIRDMVDTAKRMQILQDEHRAAVRAAAEARQKADELLMEIKALKM